MVVEAFVDPMLQVKVYESPFGYSFALPYGTRGISAMSRKPGVLKAVLKLPVIIASL